MTFEASLGTIDDVERQLTLLSFVLRSEHRIEEVIPHPVFDTFTFNCRLRNLGFGEVRDFGGNEPIEDFAVPGRHV